MAFVNTAILLGMVTTLIAASVKNKAVQVAIGMIGALLVIVGLSYFLMSKWHVLLPVLILISGLYTLYARGAYQLAGIVTTITLAFGL